MDYIEKEAMQQERDIMFAEETVQTFRDGRGVIAPTGDVSDVELTREIHASQEKVTDPAVVCFDEREALEEQPVREKMAGGNVTTPFAAAELANWSLYTDAQRAGSTEERVEAVASHMVNAGETLGGHIDNHATDEKCNCGAADGYPLILGAIAEHGNDEEFVTQARNTLGEHFDETVWAGIVSNAAEKAADPQLATWNGNIIIQAIRRHNGVVEVLNGNNTRPDKDPENQRHNHWSEGLGINFKPGTSNNRDKSKIPYFQADVAPIVRVCQEMAVDEAEFSRLLHAAVAYQFGTRYHLTSDQRNVSIK